MALLGGLALPALARESSLRWGFDQDWSLVSRREEVDQLAQLWQPLQAPCIVFPGLQAGFTLVYDPERRHFSGGSRPIPLAYALDFLKATNSTPIIPLNPSHSPDLNRTLVTHLLEAGRIPYLLLTPQDQLAAQLSTLGRLIPLDHLAVLAATPPEGIAIAYPARHIPVHEDTVAARRRALVLSLQPLLKAQSWFLGIEPVPMDRELHMYLLTWLIRQPTVTLTLAGIFWGTDGLVAPDFQTTETYAWWRSLRANSSGGLR